MTEEYLVRENQMRSDALSSRVSLLKSLAIDIEDETKDQNVFLDETEKEIVGVSGYVQHGRKRVGQILAAGRRDRKTMIYTAVGVALFLFAIYTLFSKLLSSSSGTSAPPPAVVPSTDRH